MPAPLNPTRNHEQFSFEPIQNSNGQPLAPLARQAMGMVGKAAKEAQTAMGGFGKNPLSSLSQEIANNITKFLKF